MNYSEIYKRLPKVLGDHIATFNVAHRKNTNIVFDDLDKYYHQQKLFPVMDELYDYCHLVYCDNDMCESEVYKEECIQTQFCFIKDVDFYFCCDHCESYGSWSIRYDYRKSLRHIT